MKRLLVAIALMGCGQEKPAATADEIWLNGVVYTVDARFSRVEAIAVRGERILAAGSNADVRALAGPATKVHDLGGRCVTPGLIDSHGHMQALGRFATGRLDLHDARRFGDVVDAVRAAVGKARPGEWIVGGRWDESLWDPTEPPTHPKLSEASPANPVWLMEPYADRPVDGAGKPFTGRPAASPEQLRGAAEYALRNGWQLCVHAIGDAAIHETLDACEAALRAVPTRDPRFRIEHAQCPAVADIPRFARLGVIPSMQQTHATSDRRWAEARLGPERLKGAYAWRRFYDAGSRIAGGSDFPVENENPLGGIQAGVTRGGWRPEERQTREEALRSFTIDAARAAFEEGIKGSIEAGKLTDFVVWSADIVTCPPDDLPGAMPVTVVIGGRIERGTASK